MAALRTRRLGRTGLIVTELGMGAMDTPTSPEGDATLQAALDHGITFVDTARDYAGSEMLIGRIVRARAEAGFHVASKTFQRGADGSQWDVDRSLSALSLPSISLYQLHDISTEPAWDEVMGEHGALAGLQVARYRGLIGHIGISSHHDELVERAITCGEFDTVMLEYSAFYPQTARLIDLAAERDIGVIVMRPLGGSGRTTTMRGRIADGSAGTVTPANLLRYVLSNPGVSVVIPGMSHPERVHENVAVALSRTPMDAGERAELERAAARFYE